MAVIGTFSSFTTARLAIYASQASLNVTGNNIANINTEGYTRQRMDLVSLYSYGTAKFNNIFNTNIGYGVLTNGATQLRDPYLDIRYRDENCKLGQTSEWLDGLSQMSRILDEVAKGNQGFGVIEAQLGTLKEALENLSNKLDSTEYDDLVRSQAKTLTTYFNDAAKELQTIWDNKRLELDDAVNDVNSLLTQIRDLNEKIRTQSIYGDKALELRDARNVALDKLSEYMNIKVEYSMERIDQFTEVEKLTVYLADSKGPDGERIELVNGIYGGQISIPELEPVLNPKADASEILKVMDEVRAKIEGTNAKTEEPWATKFADEKAKAEAEARAEAEAANPLTPGSDWADKITAAETKAQAAAEKKYPEDPDDPNNQDRLDAIAAEVKAAGDKIRNQREAVIQEAVDSAGRIAERKVENERLAAIEKEISEAPEIAEAIKKYGKYLLNDGSGDATNDLLDEFGNYLVDDATGETLVKTRENDKFIIQVEPLEDERGRLMIDPNTASKRSEVVELGDNVLTGKIQAIREMLTEEGEYASDQDLGNTNEALLSDDPNAAIKRGIPYYQKALDSLARKIAEQFNAMNQMPASTVYQSAFDAASNAQVFLDADGNPLTKEDGVTPITWDDVTTTLKDDDGNEVLDENGDPIRTLLEPGDPGYEDAHTYLEKLRVDGVKDPIYGFYDGGVLFSNNGNTNDPNEITAANISIALDWANGSVRILNSTQPDYYTADGELITHTSLNDNILHMISQYDAKIDYFAADIQPDAASTKPMFSGTFREVFTALAGTLADDANTTNSRVNSYTLMTLDLDNDRLSVSGVDLNEEATSMMQFSKSYAAACKLLTTLDSMLDTLINGTI